MPWEIDFIVWLQSLGQQGSIVYYINRFFTFFGEDLFMAGIFCLFYWSIDKKAAVRLGLAACASCALNSVVKNIIQRPRPWAASDEIRNLKDVSGFSFPSGHSQNGALLYFSLAGYFRKAFLYAIAAVLTVLVMLSRNYLGAHYPTDVIIGAAIGVLCAFTLPKLAEKHEKAFIVALLAIPLPFLFLPFFADYFANTQSDLFASYGMSLGMIVGVKIERRFVNFKDAESASETILRTIFGAAVLVAVQFGLKAIFSLIATEGFAANWLKLLRYTILFVIVAGIYPMSFGFISRISGRKKLGNKA